MTRKRINLNKIVALATGPQTGAGSTTVRFWNENGGAQFYLAVTSISGTLDIQVKAEIKEQTAPVLTFSQQTAATPDLIVEHLPVCPSTGEVELTWTDDVEFSIWVQGLQPVGTPQVDDQANAIEEALHVKDPTIENLAMPTAGTEYSYALPTGTKRFSVFARGKSRLQLAYSSGQTGVEYVTIKPGYQYPIPDIRDDASLTLYLQASKAGETAEIESWA